MPRIDKEFLDCIIYLYPSESDAKNRQKLGGSGFLVYLNETHDGFLIEYTYAVTNHHVAKEAPVISLNDDSLTVDTIPLTVNHWISHQDGDDLAVAFIAPEKSHLVKAFPITSVLDKTYSLEGEAVGIGDDVFMVGRFSGHEGIDSNTPVSRFGNVSMMPINPVKQPGRNNFEQESYLVEMRSLPGFSGSPVWSYKHAAPSNKNMVIDTPRYAPLDPKLEDRGLMELIFADERPRLIGINWGNLPVTQPAIIDGNKVKISINSGLMTVVPSWKLRELLGRDELRQARQDAAKQLLDENKNNPAANMR